MTDFTFWLALAGTVLGGLSAVLHLVAPRTKTTLDDKLRDDVDELLRFVKETPTPSADMAKLSSSVVSKSAAFLLVVGLAGMQLAACATVGADVKAFKDGAVTCLKGDEPAAKSLGLQLVTAAAADLLSGKSLADTWTDVSNAAEAGAKAQGVPVAACAFDGVLADIQALLHPPAQAGIAARVAGPDPLAAGRAALEQFKAAHGVTSVSR